MYFRVRILKQLSRDHFAKKSRIIKLIIKENLFCCCASRDSDDLGHSDDDCEVRLRSSNDSGNHSSSNDVERGLFVQQRLRSGKNTQLRSDGKAMDWRALRQSGVNLISTKSLDRGNCISTNSDLSYVDNRNATLIADNENRVKIVDKEGRNDTDWRTLKRNGVNTISKKDISINVIENGATDILSQTDFNKSESTT